MREKIKLTDNGLNLMMKMSEGNPGGLRILGELSTKERSLIYILGLDDMNIRGWQIWCGYKDYCKCDIDKFIEAIKNRDEDMVDVINKSAIRMNVPERAIISGASYNR